MARQTILVTTGSYCPVHEGHLQMFIKAKTRLNQGQTFHGLMSPSGRAYVAGKLGMEYVDAAVRVKQCQQALREAKLDMWVSVDAFESEQARFVDYPEVVRRIQRKHPTADVWYVCGSDHYLKCGAQGLPTVVVERPGYPVTESSLEGNCCLVATAPGEKDISSTEIRKQAKQQRQQQRYQQRQQSKKRRREIETVK